MSSAWRWKSSKRVLNVEIEIRYTYLIILINSYRSEARNEKNSYDVYHVNYHDNLFCLWRP